MATNKDDFTCSVCKQLYKNPVVHRPCGISFDLECIGRTCPMQRCQQVIKEDDLIVNYTLLKIVDEYRLRIALPPTYYLILLDTSTSMWYSDSWPPFAFGKSRFTSAIQFLTDFFEPKMNSMTEKVSLVTFHTSPLQQFDFSAIDNTHLEILQNLTCDGKDTALFDSIDFCLNKFEQLQTILGDEMTMPYLFILTDGGSNFGKKESEHATKLLWRSKELHISGHMIQIGDKNRSKTRTICDLIKYKYNHFKGGNVAEFVNSFGSTINTETRDRAARTRASRARASRAQPVIDPTIMMINQLPDAPNTPIKVRSKQKELA